MKVVAVSHSKPRNHEVNGSKVMTSIVHDPLTAASDCIELNEHGVSRNKTAVHDGPVYAVFAENYDYWCQELGVDRSAWGWCHWGENITIGSGGKSLLEPEVHLGDVWKIGKAVRLEVCGSRIPCSKLAWRCGQKDTWLQKLAATGRVGVYLRVLTGGQVHPGDEVSLESSASDALDVARITQAAFDTPLTTKDTLNLIANHKLLLGLNRWVIRRRLTAMEDKESLGLNAWKGWRSLRPYRIVDEGAGVKSFYLRAVDGRPLANYAPGQFLTVRLPGGEVRSWTISDWLTRDEPAYYRISVKRGAGRASGWMHDECTTADTGTVLLPARSPAGRFVLDVAAPLPLRQVYLSAGVGLTPVLAMLKAHDRHPSFASAAALWIHVAPDGASFPLRDEVPPLAGRPFRRVVFFTRPRSGFGSGSGLSADEEEEADVCGVHYDHVGRPTAADLRELVGAPYTADPLGTGSRELEGRRSAVYICGPPDFERAARACLVDDVGIPPALVRSEAFSPAGAPLAAAGDVQRATVRFARSGAAAEWTRDDRPRSLLELAEAAGLAPDHGCRVGACGSCAARLVRGEVAGGVQADGSVLTCSAVPASEVVEVDL
ncbi:pyruvate kinase-like protein [Xylariaceae sp. FL0804]|nr:pyruvate kinase-like protein [Xylariaceae sp. FL0804]